jgi:hypothetical protein
MLEKTLPYQGRHFLKGGDDEDIPTLFPSSPLNDDQTIADRAKVFDLPMR